MGSMGYNRVTIFMNNGEMILQSVMDSLQQNQDSEWRDWDKNWVEGWDRESWSDDWQDSH